LRNGWVAINFGFAQGFDMYIKPQPNVDIERIRRKPPGSKALQGSDIDITESALEFIQNNHTERFFLYIHYMDVHQYVYNAASDLFGSTYLDAYDNAIHWTDSNVGTVMDTLRYLALLDNTIVVIASDHGEGFLEHGNEGHAKNLYHEVQRVPLIIVPPFELPEPVVVRGQVGNIDVIPTLLDMLGLPPLPHADGISLVPHMIAAGKGEPEPHPNRIVISQIDRWWGKPKKDPLPLVAVVRQPYRLHQRRGNINQIELFDHRDDPNETNDISRREPEVAAELLAAADDLIENGGPPWQEPEVIELDSMMLNQLRALGYAVDEN
jgi:arylsulfatase A-like enzyme